MLFLCCNMTCVKQAWQQTTESLAPQDFDTEENAGDTRNIAAGPAGQDLQEPCPDRSHPFNHVLLIHSICIPVCSLLKMLCAAMDTWCMATLCMTINVTKSMQLAMGHGCQL